MGDNNTKMIAMIVGGVIGAVILLVLIMKLLGGSQVQEIKQQAPVQQKLPDTGLQDSLLESRVDALEKKLSAFQEQQDHRTQTLVRSINAQNAKVGQAIGALGGTVGTFDERIRLLEDIDIPQRVEIVHAERRHVKKQ